MSDKPELIVNPLRSPHRHGTTGIYVRAKTVDNKWGSHDIAELGEMSLLAWLRSERGLAENVVRLLLGHEPVHEPPPPVHPRVEEELDAVDAAVFSGDTFFAPEAIARLRWYMARWERACVERLEPDEPVQP